MIKKSLSAILAISLTLTPITAIAKEPVNIPSPDPDTEVARISPMRKGHAAPFTGVLFSPKATATVLEEIQTFNERMKIEVDKAVKDLSAKKQFELDEATSRCTTAKTVLQADIDAKDARIKSLTKDLKDAEDAKRDAIENSPSRLLWAGLGVAAGAATAILITFAVNQASK